MHASAERDGGDSLVEVTAASQKRAALRPRHATRTTDHGRDVPGRRAVTTAPCHAAADPKRNLHVRGRTVEPVLGVVTVLSTIFSPGSRPSRPGLRAVVVLGGTFPGTVRPGYVYLPPDFTPLGALPGALPAARDARLAVGVPRRARSSPSAPTRRSPRSGCGRSSRSSPPPARSAGYNGEWAGPWEDRLVERTIPWVDANLPTIPTAGGRVIAGLSAGGFGAIDIALRHPDLFGAAESWSGYFKPLHDGPFKGAKPDGARGARSDGARPSANGRRCDRRGLRFFVSSGPSHSHWFRESATVSFARELRGLGLPVALRLFPTRRGEWRDQLDAGLAWAFPDRLSA